VITKPLMRYHGGKFRLAQWVMQFFPAHQTYVEPFGGAGGVLLQKPRCYSEVYNDLDQDIVNVFRVLRDPEQAKSLAHLIEFTPYARDEFNLAYEPTDNPIESARRTLIRAEMGFGSAGATKHKTGFRIDTAREYSTSSHLWPRLPAQLKQFTDRLRGVLIENRPALKVIENHDRADTLFYVDPPYRFDTRQMGSNRRYYNHEMTDEQHDELLSALVGVQGMVVLSGYDSDQYNDTLKGWSRHSTKARISSGRGTGIREEVVWLNPPCTQQQSQIQLFESAGKAGVSA